MPLTVQGFERSQAHTQKTKRFRETIDKIAERSQSLFSKRIRISFKPSRSHEMGLMELNGFSMKAGIFGEVLLRVCDVTNQWFLSDKRMKSIVEEEINKNLSDIDIKLIYG